MGLGHRSLKAGSGKSDVSNQVRENVTRTRRTQRKGQVMGRSAGMGRHVIRCDLRPAPMIQ